MEKGYWIYDQVIDATRKDIEGLVDYEIWMFEKTCEEIDLINQNNHIKDGVEKFKINLLLESLALHSRVLIEFFYSEKQYPNDLVAQEFLPLDIVWREIRPNVTVVLKDTKNKADKQLAHITRWRVKLERDFKKDWNMYKIIKEDLDKVIKKFKENYKK